MKTFNDGIRLKWNHLQVQKVSEKFYHKQESKQFYGHNKVLLLLKFQILLFLFKPFQKQVNKALNSKLSKAS